MEYRRKGMPAGAILTVLALVLIPVLLMVFLMPSGSGSGAYRFYAGPVLPMTAVSGAEALEVKRNVDFDFLPYSEPQRSGLDTGSAVITDTYILENPTGNPATTELAYGFQGQFTDPPEEYPRICVNGEEIRARIVSSVDVSGELHRAVDWAEYRAALTGKDHLAEALRAAPTWEQEVTLVEFRNFACDRPATEEPLFFGVRFPLPEGTEVWCDVFAMTRGENGMTEVYFRSDAAPRLWFVGEPPRELVPVGNAGYNFRADTALTGVTAEMEQSTADFQEIVMEYGKTYNFWEENPDYPNAGLVTPELLCEGAVKRLLAPEYVSSSGRVKTLEALFYQAVTEIRMLYWVFPVEIPAGGSVTVAAVYTQEPSRDTSGPEKHREGYDMATRLGSALSFTAQSATLTNSHLIRILDQNFGFDLERGITEVALDITRERYYLDVSTR